MPEYRSYRITEYRSYRITEYRSYRITEGRTCVRLRAPACTCVRLRAHGCACMRCRAVQSGAVRSGAMQCSAVEDLGAVRNEDVVPCMGRRVLCGAIGHHEDPVLVGIPVVQTSVADMCT